MEPLKNILSGVCVAGGLACLVYGTYKYGLKRYRLAATPPGRSLPECLEHIRGASTKYLFSGCHMKLLGTARAVNPGSVISAGASGLKCVYARTASVRSLRTRQARLGGWLPFARKPRTLAAKEQHTTEEFTQECREIPWAVQLSDDSRVLVITEGADMLLESVVSSSQVDEAVIRHGAPVVVIGHVKEIAPGVLQVSRPMLRWFFIFAGSEEQLRSIWTWALGKWIVLGAGLVGLSRWIRTL